MTLGSAEIYTNIANKLFVKGVVALNCTRTESSVPSGTYLQSEFSITLWLNLQTFDNSASNNVLRFCDTSSGYRDVIKFLNSQQLNYLQGRVGAWFTVTSSIIFPRDVWTFVTITCKQRNVKIYFNETLVASANNLNRNTFQSNENTFGIASLGFLLMDFKIYNRSITEEEIAIEYNSRLFNVQTITKN